MTRPPNFEEVFNKISHCSNCGEKELMCDCRDDDIPDWDKEEIDEY